MKKSAKFMNAGTKVRVAVPSGVPNWSVWDDDHQRTSTPVKKRLQELFFKGDKKISGSIVFIGSESLRDELRRKNLVKVEVRDPAGCRIVITADAANLHVA